jgi:hypothetical protein
VTPPAELQLASPHDPDALRAGKVRFVVKINGETAVQRFVMVSKNSRRQP